MQDLLGGFTIESPLEKIRLPKLVVGLKFLNRNEGDVRGVLHMHIPDGQPLFVLSTGKAYRLAVRLTFHEDNASLIKTVKSISVKLPEREEIMLQIEREEIISGQNKLDAVASFELHEEETETKHSGNENVWFKEMEVDLSIETSRSQLFNIGIPLFYTTSKNGAHFETFKRQVPEPWRNNPHKEQDLDYALLFYGQ